VKKVDVTYTERGFPVFGEPVITQYGHPVRVYGSSAAMYDAVWLDIGESTKPGCEAITGTAHMNLEQATLVRDHLSTWINTITGYDDSDVAALRARIEHLEQWRTELADQLAPHRTQEEW
jgi:hypothetical protein